MIQNGDDIQFGQPYISNSSVEAEVLETGKREKDIVFKFKRKTGYKLTRGHRQNSTVIKISKNKHWCNKIRKQQLKKKQPTKTTKKTTTSKKTKERSKGVNNGS